MTVTSAAQQQPSVFARACVYDVATLWKGSTFLAVSLKVIPPLLEFVNNKRVLWLGWGAVMETRVAADDGGPSEKRAGENRRSENTTRQAISQKVALQA